MAREAKVFVVPLGDDGGKRCLGFLGDWMNDAQSTRGTGQSKQVAKYLVT